jgi:hypothetical protein
VVHRAPTQAKATAAVVEFPSDDEEDEA